MTGGLKDLELHGNKSASAPKSLSEYWDKGALTYLGMTVHGFPNFFFTYGPQAPTAVRCQVPGQTLCSLMQPQFSNGPSCVEPQADWIIDVMSKMRKQGLQRIEATREAEEDWKEQVMKFSKLTLRHDVPSWYNGWCSGCAARFLRRD